MTKRRTPPQPEVPARIDFAEFVYPPYHGEPTHPDPTRLIVPIGAVHRDPENARLHGERNLRHLRASLRRGARGQQTPINVDRTGKILKGNGTHESAELEGWGFIWIVVSGLEGAEAKAYENADNATGLSSTWDFARLASDVRSLKELDDSELAFSNDELGFEAHELSPMLNATWQPPSAVEGPSDAPGQPHRGPGQGKDPHPDLEAGDRAADNCSIICTPNMRVMIDQAIERVRLLSGELSLTEGRCIELICADYLADPNNDLPPELQIKED